MGQRKRFADGKVSLPYGHFLGYQKGPDNLPEIVEEEAVIVRLIYRMFLYGKSPSAIASHLTDEGIPSRRESSLAGQGDRKHPYQRLSYNKHNLRKARKQAAFTGYAYFLFLQIQAKRRH